MRVTWMRRGDATARGRGVGLQVAAPLDEDPERAHPAGSVGAMGDVFDAAIARHRARQDGGES